MSGAIAGLVGAIAVFGIHHRYIDGMLVQPLYAWTGIIAVLLVGMIPWLVPLSGFFFAAIQTGAAGMERTAGVPKEIALVMQAVIILFVASRVSGALLASSGRKARRRRRCLSSCSTAPSLASVPRFVTPILLAALGGALCERAGVFNIALEGFMLAGAFAAVLGAYFSGSPYVGALAAMLAGIAMGAGLCRIQPQARRRSDRRLDRRQHPGRRADHVPAARDLPCYRRLQRSGHRRLRADPHSARRFDVPFVGRLLSGQSILFYCRGPRRAGAACLLRAPSARPAHARSGREPGGAPGGRRQPAPGAAAAALVGCGAFCGLAGAQLSIANVNLFVENMSAGRGWIAVVAVLSSRGRPLPLFLIAVVFGVVDSLSFRVQGFGLPQQFTDMMPYLATLVVLVGLSWWRRRQTV